MAALGGSAAAAARGTLPRGAPAPARSGGAEAGETVRGGRWSWSGEAQVKVKSEGKG